MILAIIQARMGSSRLPGKVLLQASGKPLLQWQLERVAQAKGIDRTMVATTVNDSDKAIAELCKQLGIGFYQGSENDVLDRYYQAALHGGCSEQDSVIRLTADCPLIDPSIIREVIRLFENTGVDYASNVNPPTFPDGLDIEIFRFSALLKAWQEAGLKSEREHVTPYIRNHPEIFSQANYAGDRDFSSQRWTVDEQRDFDLIANIIDHFSGWQKPFYMDDILEYLEANPALSEINQDIGRNEGYAKSLAEDESVQLEKNGDAVTGKKG